MPCDIIKLEKKLQSNNIIVHKRQIYRDIKSVEKYFLSENEKLEEAKINENKRAWNISNKKNKNIIGIDELYAKLILFNNVPSYISDKSKKTLQDEIVKDINLKNNHIIFKSIEAINSFLKTDFYEKYYCVGNEKKIKDIFWCIINQRKIKVKKLTYQPFNQNADNTEFIFSPITFLLHRGSILVAGFTKNNRVYIIDLTELSEYDYLNTTFKKKENLLLEIETELKNRFGICENYDNEIYNISIELTREIGEYLNKYKWHHSQKFKVTTNGYIVNFNCGINKELLSWIFMLHTDAKIIKPEKLKQVYCRYLMDLKKMYFDNPFNLYGKNIE